MNPSEKSVLPYTCLSSRHKRRKVQAAFELRNHDTVVDQGRAIPRESVETSCSVANLPFDQNTLENDHFVPEINQGGMIS